MKVYIVTVINYYEGGPNYKVSSKVFTDKIEAIQFQAKKRNEYPIRWDGPYNYVELFEQELKI